jgi:DNA gyrase subunit A
MSTSTPSTILDAALHEEAQRRYLNYALSVITSRALPDVRDGLKPVQRRILYAMFANLHLTPDAKYKKSATVVGDVIGKFHPHGDTAIYDALVRMAQWFSLRSPLVDGHGNFGSVDGDGAAAYRYTECRLQPAAMLMLEEIKKRTVHFRPNFDGQYSEPVVLPARLPNLLVNGCTGIAVGMATNVPPHHLGEVCTALSHLIDDPALETKDLCKFIKGPDFPTGGWILNSRAELREIYETGQGAVRVRGEYTVDDGLPKGKDKDNKKAAVNPSIIVTSIPYGLTTSSIVEKIAAEIIAKKLPQLIDVRNESTDDIRIVLELKKGADAAMTMAYLFKHTPLQANFNVNLTCLVPTANPEVGAPRRLDLKSICRHFLDFRFEVVTKRFEHELAELQERIHLLQGFAKIYDALDETIRIIRKSEGKKDAAEKLIKRFELDAEQVDAILELKLYKLARLEIQIITEELAAKEKEAKRLSALLASPKKRWGVVQNELTEIAASHGDKRRTRIGGTSEEPEFDADAFIQHEDTHVVLTRDGWVKRVRELKDPTQTRLREGDSVMTVLQGNTRETAIFFSNYGSAYSLRMLDVPPSTGYGDPVQKLFKFRDGERVIAALSLDPRVLAGGAQALALAITRQGFGLRFALADHAEPSTRTGRRYARPATHGDKGDKSGPQIELGVAVTGPPPDDDEVLGVVPVGADDILVVASEQCRVLMCPAAEVSQLAGPGRGVTVLKLEGDDRVLGFGLGELTVETAKGKTVDIRASDAHIVSRGGKGTPMWKRERFTKVVQPALKLLALSEPPPPPRDGGGAKE